MARPDLFSNRKFFLLTRRLGSRMLAVGALECVWSVGYSAGDPMVGGPEEVEAICEWTGEKGSLCAALVESGFLDEESDGSLTIHDLYDHAPVYVQKRMRSEAKRREAGTTLSDLRRGAAALMWEKRRAKQTDEPVMQTDATGIHVHANGTTPSPNDRIRLHPFASEGEEPAEEPKAPRPRKAPASGAVGAYLRAWEARYGGTPLPEASECIAANKALSRFTEEERVRIVEAYVADDEPWICDKAHPLGLLPKRLGRLQAKLNGTLSTGRPPNPQRSLITPPGFRAEDEKPGTSKLDGLPVEEV